ncbi:hypothetical protein GCM10011349_20200 [Novosphingobium indicum]|uniref:Uncharacterized protein n=1 Tax=Novosphingobium indicum TaxID=462949 RepID=A0ABQ2JKF0_9SPHN|nr:hypothetical protein [Novosphingobium indicum]GGN49506.1 hypothetical protein GCM10011349_20200 [Novosphingobium indicum]
MSNPTIAGKRPAYSASNALAALGRAISEIKAEDGLTWSDVGAILGVSDDQASKYAEGTATMNAVTFGRGKREWNGRFTGYFDRLCVESRPGSVDDRLAAHSVLQAAMTLSDALTKSDEIPLEMIRANRAVLENARDAIEEQLSKLRPAA